MDHETEKYWGTLLLRMAADARQEGDLVTAELLSAHAKDYLDEGIASHRVGAWNLRTWKSRPCAFAV